MEKSAFTISLDFELFWGVRDKRSVSQYEANLRGVHSAIEQILSLFRSYGIHATWAVVGFLFFESFEDLIKNCPEDIPFYSDKSLSPYTYLNHYQSLEKKYHLAPELLELICQTVGQEIATHTFSHYYCLEGGHSKETFFADLNAAVKVGSKRGAKIQSIVFPRNQCNFEYLPLLKSAGIKCYRGNEKSWLYTAVAAGKQFKIKRAFRLLDAYVNISGNHTFSICPEHGMINIQSSRFLRPYSKKLAFLDDLRLRRITKSMDHAAKKNEIFHLWFHPHNFGVYTEQNIAFLKKILDHFSLLRDEIGMQSLNMVEVADCLACYSGEI